MADDTPPMEPDNPSHEALPELAVTPLKLKGEPATDQGFTTGDGDKIRVRVVVTDEQRTRAPVSGDEEVAPSSLTLSLTIAALDSDGSVKMDSQGRLLISDRHEILISDEALKLGGFDPEAAVQTAIRQQAFCMKERLANRAKVADYLTRNWGGADLPAPADQVVLRPLTESAIADQFVPPPSPEIISERSARAADEEEALPR